VVRADIAPLTHPPVQAHLSGSADIGNGIHGSTVDAIRRAEYIAAPFLLIVLLLVFRSPIAAALPLGAGLMTIGAGQGVLSLANGPMTLDVVALNLTSMMGLALGVDYALLLVSRFREELAAGLDERAAALTAVETAGRTIGFAGAALAAARCRPATSRAWSRSPLRTALEMEPAFVAPAVWAAPICPTPSTASTSGRAATRRCQRSRAASRAGSVIVPCRAATTIS